ncbi:hypothetical protein [Priestia koreensis]|uniref:hypothetical protein n=1 Tax=Priestia koreensis TaxID=284581 RepID=UPI00203C6206|nr:hypothetical protein [Priestia koreensis]MCM3004641.1 hypothetical protein [Priestia koreensis]
MLKNLPQGTKISITRSIHIAFEQYMSNIQWNENQFDINDFIQQWKQYIEQNASWFKNLDAETKADPIFHEELAVKINETIEKILAEEPTEEQIHKLEELTKSTGKEIDYSSKLEARYLIDTLSN